MTTPRLLLPELSESQASKEVKHNEALRLLEAVIAVGVIDKDLATPPGSPAEGDVYIIAAAPTGAWTGQAKSLTMFSGGAWIFVLPKSGMRVWVIDEAKLYRYDGAAWVEALPSILRGSITFDPANAVDGAGETSTSITVTGAALGDLVVVSFSLDLQGILLTGYVDATNSVKCRFQNETVSTINLGSGTLRALVFKA
jgi:hypothetical protein